MFILPQMAQITQRNAAGCIITQRKTDWVGGEFLCGSVVLWFVCVNQRDQREILGFLLCGLIKYSCVLFSRRYRRLRRGIQLSCIISQRNSSGLLELLGIIAV